MVAPEATKNFRVCKVVVFKTANPALQTKLEAL
jgi:hypothetical protein